MADFKEVDDLLKQDFYDLLDVSRNASIKEIGNAYKKKAKEWHPDRWINSPKKLLAEKVMKVLVQAKDTLTNPQKRFVD